jgi:hypothetical protein
MEMKRKEKNLNEKNNFSTNNLNNNNYYNNTYNINNCCKIIRKNLNPKKITSSFAEIPMSF